MQAEMDLRSEKITEAGKLVVNIDHPVRQTRIARSFFEKQDDIEKIGLTEGLGSGGDFKQVFLGTFFEIEKYALEKGWPEGIFKGVSGKNLREKAEEFLRKFAEIKMDDTFYHGTESALRDMFGLAADVVLYTQGDSVVQPKKIENSRVRELLSDARAQSTNRAADINEIIAQKKESEIPEILRKFVMKSGSSEITVVVFEDNIANFALCESNISDFEIESGVKVKRLFVWSKSGRVAEEISDDEEKKQLSKIPGVVKVDDLLGMVGIMQDLNVDPGSTVVFLDFDGALSDNRLMRSRQAHVAYKELMSLLRSLVQDYVGWNKRDAKTAVLVRDEIRNLYLRIDSLWRNQ